MGHSSHDHHVHNAATNKKGEYRKLYLVFGFILLLSGLIAYVDGHWEWMLALDYIMGTFFLVFGLFKLFEYKMFAFGYKDYDLIAKRLPGWGYAYPWVELLLGVLYILHVLPLWLNGVTVLLMSINALGVYLAIRQKEGNQPACLCLGAVVKLPLSTISMLENVSMGLMALIMFVALLLGVPHPAM